MSKEEILTKISTVKTLIETEITETHPLYHLRDSGLRVLDSVAAQVHRGQKLREASAMIQKMEALWDN